VPVRNKDHGRVAVAVSTAPAGAIREQRYLFRRQVFARLAL
jgi:hypothetical protein